MKPGQFSLRKLFSIIAVIAMLIAGGTALLRSWYNAHRLAEMQAIRAGRLDLEEENVKGHLSPQEYDQLRKELGR